MDQLQLPIYSVPKLNTLVLNKAFKQRSVSCRPQRWVSCIPQLSSSVRAMTVASDEVKSDPVHRRTANYHSDLWNDDFLQSLPNTPYHHASYQGWANNLVVKINEMFRTLEDGEISPSAYDTAWVAMVPEKDGSNIPRFPRAIKWLIRNQLEDGSWGLPSTFMLCDRLLSTLASLVALLTWSTGHPIIEKGVRFIEDHLNSLEREESLSPDFEIIFPALMKKAGSLGLSLPYNASLMNKRAALLTDISLERGIPTHMLNALEGLEEIIDWKKMMTLLSKDGSFLSSPASTACVLINTGDDRCFKFLNDLMNKFQGCVPCLYPIDLLERLLLVDNIERLGIAHHFKEEITVALDYVYGYWSEKGIGWGRESLFPDLNTTAIGFRTLRIYRYNVSPEVLNSFKYENGCFFSFAGERHIEHRSIVNLLRASDLAFPGESIMDEARLFASRYLSESLLTNYILSDERIAKETEYALNYSWHRSMSNLEARSYIDAYDDNHAWLRKTLFRLPYVNNTSCVDLGKLYFNIEQSLHQKELNHISSWWKKSGMAELDFGRQRMLEWFTSGVLFEPEYSLYRIAIAKKFCLLGFIDDTYDTYGTIEELRIFTEAIKRWDTSLIDELPDYMKIIFKVWYETMNELKLETRKQQGRDMMHHIKKDWVKYINAIMREREWSETGYMPSIEEYFKNRIVSLAIGPSSHPIFLMGEVITDNDLPVTADSSKMFQLMIMVGRILNDLGTTEHEMARGVQAWSLIACYMKENLGSTKEDCLNHYGEIVDHILKQMNYEYFKAIDAPPKCGETVLFKFRIPCLVFYKYGDRYGDGYADSKNESKEMIEKTLIDPVELW